MFSQLPQNVPSSIIVCIAEINEKTTKSGNPYQTITLVARDNTRQNINLWQGGPPPPPIGALTKLKATWSSGEYGLEAKDPTFHACTEEESSAFAQCFTRPESALAFATINYFIDHCVHGPCQPLLQWLMRTHGTAYQRAAAARSNHQPYSGGLAEHTAAMLSLASAICRNFNEPPLADFYKNPVDSSIIYTAIIFHDSGKIWENNYSPGPIPCHMPYERIAEYHGHIAIGHALIIQSYRETASDHATPFQSLPDHIHHLCHCILSHHGQLEWGSPIEPKTLESHILHTIDNLEAKTWMHVNNMRKHPPLPGHLHRPSFGPIRMTIAPMPTSE